MEIITKDALNDYVLTELKTEARSVFGSKFRDLNTVDNATRLRIYLTSVNLGDEAKYDTVLSSHNPSQIRTNETNRKISRLTRKRALLTKLSIDANDFRALRELITDGNDD